MIDFIATNDVARLAVLILVFIVVLGLVAFLVRYFSDRSTVQKQIAQIGAPSRQSISSGKLVETKSSAWLGLLDRVEKSGLSLADTRGDKLRKQLVAAGYTASHAPRVFTLTRIFLVFLLPVLFFVVVSLTDQDMGIFQLYLLGVVFAAAGLFLPNLYVSAKAARREETIRKGFPDCLDLMLVCVEAGLGLESAMDRVGREMIGSHPLISELLSLATLEMRAGASRDDALRKMGDMSGVDEIRSFSTLLIQSDRMGTSVAETLRVYADEMREKRRLRAEEKAHRLPVLISIPLVVCMLPTMIGVLMIPGVVRAVRTLFPALSGG
ncbi:type II secretion system F family protein [Aurantiacibacter odishensis]|uniref:type II secretion system F family protein n=1 Tax=Aurantiacibacter odishensis TaxID=1155476 RepID=UPI000E752E7D|nr:type II secretion system F family protein [Aurantiacibacter odishensis]